MKKIRVIILFGGRSAEHEVSILSARNVLGALDRARFEPVLIGIDRAGAWHRESERTLAGATGDPRALALDPQAPTVRIEEGLVGAAGTSGAAAQEVVVFPVLHGTFGEDGTVQGLLELLDVAYVGAGVAASALAMDKDLFKKVMRDSGIPVAAHHAIRLGDGVENPFGYPVFVKPARLGSSVGITKVHSEEELGPAVELAFRHDEKVLVEEFVAGTEVEVGVLGNRVPPPIASLPGQIDTLEHEWYDFASKYDEGGMELLVPPPGLAQETVELLQRRAVDSFVASECEGLARVDFFVRESDGEVVLNELNTMPCFTATSVWARLFEASGLGYADALDRLIELALERHERRSKLVY